VHPFWLSHEEKRPWLELSMEGQPWPVMGELAGEGREGKWRGRGGHGWGARGGCRRGARPCCSERSPCYCAWFSVRFSPVLREEESRKEEGEEKREK
jgi:hypothetical protein